MSVEKRKEKAVRVILSIPTGKFEEGAFAPDFFAWTGLSGKVPGDVFRERVGVIGQVFKPPGLKMTIDRVTGEEDRVSVQCRGEGVVFNGEPYKQSYHYLIEFDDQDRVRHLREYIDTKIVADMLRPAMLEWSEKHAGRPMR